MGRLFCPSFGLALMGSTGALQAQREYWEKVRALFGSSLIGYWPLWEASGLVAEDISGNERNGTYRDVALAGDTNTLTGKPAPVWDGANGKFVNLNSSGAAPSFDEGAVVLLVKPSSDLMASTGTRRMYYFANSTSGKSLQFSKVSAAQILAQGRFVGSYNPYNQFGYLIDGAWHLLVSTWSLSQGLARVYVNGNLAVSGPVTTSEADVPNIILIGASGSNSESWKGSISDVALLNRYVTTIEATKIFNVLFGGFAKTVALLGDSISTSTVGWHTFAFGNYANGRTKIINHAVSGNSIMGHLDKQTAEAAGDRADVIILALGTNDDGAGDMEALQAKVESGIDALQASNPGARLYYMNVLPRFDGVDRSAVRAAIAAACAAKGVACWDTYTDPWIAQADTSDNLHPNATGHAKIAAQVLARL